MRRIFVGLVLGTILGVTIPAVADVGTYFYTVKEFLQNDTAFQNGYIAGVFDAVQGLAKAGQDRGINTRVLVIAVNCLDGHVGRNLGTFRGWATSALGKYRPSAVAANAILSECLP